MQKDLEQQIIANILEARTAYGSRQDNMRAVQGLLEGKSFKVNQKSNDADYVQQTVFNVVQNTSRITYGSLSKMTYRAVLQPKALGHIKKISALESFINDKLNEANWNYKIKHAIKQTINLGGAPVDLAFTPKGDICIDVLDYVRFYVDPNATNVNDSNYYFYEELATPDRLLELGVDIDVENGKTSDPEVIIGSDRNQANGNKVENRSNVANIYHYYWKEWDELESEEDDIKEGYRYYSAIFDDYSLLTSKEELDIDDFYCTVLGFNEIHDTPWFQSDVEMIATEQVALNKMTSSLTTGILMNAGNQMVINLRQVQNVKQVLKARMNPNGAMFVTGDARNAIVALEKNKIPDATLQTIQLLMTHMKDQAGVAGAYQGEMGSLQGGTAVEGATNRATLIDNPKFVEIDYFAERLVGKFIKMLFNSIDEVEIVLTEEELIGFGIEPIPKAKLPKGKKEPRESRTRKEEEGMTINASEDRSYYELKIKLDFLHERGEYVANQFNLKIETVEEKSQQEKMAGFTQLLIAAANAYGVGNIPFSKEDFIMMAPGINNKVSIINSMRKKEAEASQSAQKEQQAQLGQELKTVIPAIFKASKKRGEGPDAVPHRIAQYVTERMNNPERMPEPTKKPSTRKLGKSKKNTGNFKSTEGLDNKTK